jgi:hypothetical protein
MEQEIREMDCRVLAEYAYPDDPAYNYIVRQFGLDGEWYLPYEAEVNSGSGIGADYAQFISEDLDEVVADAKNHLEGLIELDFTEPEFIMTEHYEGYEVEYENNNGVFIANIRESKEYWLVEAIAGFNIEELQEKVKQFIKEKK